MHRVDPMVQASKYGIAFQHGIECLAAKAATVFSTVSSITGRECEALLGRRPDSLLPNGINIQRFEVIHEFFKVYISKTSSGCSSLLGGTFSVLRVRSGSNAVHGQFGAF